MLKKFKNKVERGIIFVINILPAFLDRILLMLINAFFRLVYMLPFVNRQRKRFDKEMKPFFQVKSIPFTFFVGALGSVFMPFLAIYVGHVLKGLVDLLLNMVSVLFKDDPISFDSTIFVFNPFKNLIMFRSDTVLTSILTILFIFIYIRFIYHKFQQFRDFNGNEEGDDKFVSDKQLLREYVKVSDRVETFSGYGGFPIAHLCSPNLRGTTLHSKMMFRNPMFINILSSMENKLKFYEKKTGYYLIETDTINAAITGMTRSGKDETIVNPMIDIISRAEIPSSLVVADPKGETYQSSYKTLRKRNYDVHVLNFQNMDFSMSYNPLALAIDSAKKGYYEKTQERVNAVAEAIYRNAKENSGNGNAKFWEDTSISLFNAIAMALIDRAKETEDREPDSWDTITIRNIAKFLSDLGSEDVYVDSEGNLIKDIKKQKQENRKSKITYYFDELRKINSMRFSKFREMADINFRTSDFASSETKGNVYTSLMAGVTLYLQDNIAKLTSANSLDLESIGNPRRLSLRLQSTTNKNEINLFSYQTAKITISDTSQSFKTIVKDKTVIIDSEGYINFVIEDLLPENFTIMIIFDHENNTSEQIKKQKVILSGHKKYKSNVKYEHKNQNENVEITNFLLHKSKKFRKINHFQLDKYTKKPVLEKVEISVKEKSEGIIIDEYFLNLTYSEKPVAIFMVTPPNRTEYNAIVSFFINQVFNANYEVALNSGRKTTNRIQFILNEFANIPTIPAMDTKLSIGLGQNILFVLLVQNLEQIADKYGKDKAATILGNCSINALIKTTSKETAKQYSELLGKKTITQRTKQGNPIQFTQDDKPVTISTSTKGQELLTSNQLLKLQAGEMVIIRGVKAQDKKGRKTTTDPIFIHGKTELPYKFMFLQKEFDSRNTISDIPIVSDHRSMNLKKLEINPEHNLNALLTFRQQLTIDVTQAQWNIRYENENNIESEDEKIAEEYANIAYER